MPERRLFLAPVILLLGALASVGLHLACTPTSAREAASIATAAQPACQLLDAEPGVEKICASALEIAAATLELVAQREAAGIPKAAGAKYVPTEQELTKQILKARAAKGK